jgi:hypothetical protein
MKTNNTSKFTAALIALGVISLASAQAATTVYLVGASALRTTIFSAATAPGVIFDATGQPPGEPKIASGAPNNTSSATYIVYEGNINGNLVDIDAYFTGAEAAVADVAGNPLTQKLQNPSFPSGANGTYPVPGTPGSFLNPNNGWTTTNSLATIAGAPALPDLALDDTSQAVSLTSKAQFPLVDYGALAVVPFGFLKGYEKTPDATWSNVVNVTTAEINQLYSGPHSANFVTGISTDSGESVALTGRNFSSGTRVNALLTSQYPITTTVDHWAYDVNYNSPGVLAAGTSYGSPGTLIEIGNDGFNTAGPAAAQLNFDGTGQQVVLIEPLAVPDALSAYQPASSVTSAGGGPATYLPYNGVYESDQGVINGSYPFWGNEHLFGSVNQQPTTVQGETGLAIANGVKSFILTNGSGTATGAVGPIYKAQSSVIPESFLQVSRAGDGGFPVPNN